MKISEKRKKWLTGKSIFKCFLLSLAILFIAAIFEIAQQIIASRLPIADRTLYVLIMWIFLSVLIWVFGLLFPDITEVVFKMLGFESEEEKKT